MNAKLLKLFNVSYYKSDEVLLQDIAHLNEGSFEVLVDRYQHSLFNYVSYMIKDRKEAEDILQDILFKIYEKASLFRNESKGKTWIWTIARNQTIDYIRFEKIGND